MTLDEALECAEKGNVTERSPAIFQAARLLAEVVRVDTAIAERARWCHCPLHKTRTHLIEED